MNSYISHWLYSQRGLNWLACLLDPFLTVAPSPLLFPVCSQEDVGRVCLKERGRDVLVLQRVTSSVTSPSDRPSPTSSGGGSRDEDCDKRSVPCFKTSSSLKCPLDYFLLVYPFLSAELYSSYYQCKCKNNVGLSL